MSRKSIAALAALLLVTATTATHAETKNLNASREQVAEACDANGGFAWGVGASSGRYGCMTDEAWVECDEDGDCAGGKARQRGLATAGRFGSGLQLSE